MHNLTYSSHFSSYSFWLFFRPWSASSVPVGATNSTSMTSAQGMARIASLLLENSANVDAQDSAGRLVNNISVTSMFLL